MSGIVDGMPRSTDIHIIVRFRFTPGHDLIVIFKSPVHLDLLSPPAAYAQSSFGQLAQES